VGEVAEAVHILVVDHLAEGLGAGDERGGHAATLLAAARAKAAADIFARLSSVCGWPLPALAADIAALCSGDNGLPRFELSLCEASIYFR
jgi:hypothetical protein